MSKKSSNVATAVPEVVAQESVPSQVQALPFAQPESLNEQDKNTLDKAKLQRQIASLEAEKSLARNESADASFKYLVLQLYVKYGLNTQNDAIGENGEIVRGALLNRQEQ